MQKKMMYFLLVLVVAGIIIVAIFIKKNSPADSNRSELTLILNSISQDAQAYYNQKDSFIGYEIPDYLIKSVGGKVKQKTNDEEVLIIGIGDDTGKNQITPVKVEAVITKNNYSVVMRN